ncbi:Predicted metal-dependent phosphoesterase TrpH, contains PHP domain [Halobellus salinus]|nr:Predicted metal-dependent phosphoesterase TrpH, contains PHP domain [Halobellus salinus]
MTGTEGGNAGRREDTATGTASRGAPENGTLVDPHVKVLNERVVDRARARGLDALVYAPHFTRLPDIRARAARFSDDDLLVVPAREVFTGTWRNRQHVLGVGLSEPVPDFISLPGALAAFERQNAAVLVPHPEFLNVSLDREAITRHADAIDAVETHNFKTLPRGNRRARGLVRETGLPAFGSSYAHLAGSVGEVWTAFERELDSESDLVAALRTGAPRRVLRRDTLGHTLRGAAEFAHLGYENSWGKVDRLFLSGTEPTHPSHVAYEGRFDDVREY